MLNELDISYGALEKPWKPIPYIDAIELIQRKKSGEKNFNEIDLEILNDLILHINKAEYGKSIIKKFFSHEKISVDFDSILEYDIFYKAFKYIELELEDSSNDFDTFIKELEEIIDKIIKQDNVKEDEYKLAINFIYYLYKATQD